MSSSLKHTTHTHTHLCCCNAGFQLREVGFYDIHLGGEGGDNDGYLMVVFMRQFHGTYLVVCMKQLHGTHLVVYTKQLQGTYVVVSTKLSQES